MLTKLPHLRFFSTLGLFFALCCSAGISNSQVHVVYTYPWRNSVGVSVKTAIGIRYTEALSRSLLTSSAVTVTGSKSGIHKGKVILAGYGRTVIFTPANIFYGGEKVLVTISSLQCLSGKTSLQYSFTFQISKSKFLPNSLNEMEYHSSEETPLSSHELPVSLPSNFPALQVTNNGDPSAGNFYLTNFTYINKEYGPYAMILDNSGDVLFQHSTYPGGAYDFRPQPNGLYTYYDISVSKFYAVDSNFIKVDSFEAANGYTTDYHELSMLPFGGYALLAYYTEKTDMRNVISDGDSAAEVIYFVLQEFDIDKNLIFEWRTQDHFDIADATNQDLTSHTIDCVHCNSIEFDIRDTTFLLSSRSLDEITKINSEDGSIIWRMGGKHNQFTLTNDTIPFSHQHHVRLLPDGNMTLFDNGNFRNAQVFFSRALEYGVDQSAKTITKVWEFRHNPDVFSSAMGSVQRLADGNTLIGWGLCDSVAATEVKPDGSTIWEMRLPIGDYNYRIYKFTDDQLRSNVASQPIPSTISLEQNYPNPFSSFSVIGFKMSERTPVTLIVYDALGREVRSLFSGTVDAGDYSSKFDAGNLPNGFYMCKLTTPFASISRMIILSR